MYEIKKSKSNPKLFMCVLINHTYVCMHVFSRYVSLLDTSIESLKYKFVSQFYSTNTYATIRPEKPF